MMDTPFLFETGKNPAYFLYRNALLAIILPLHEKAVTGNFFRLFEP